jgi:fatty-acyl-CoA synthase
MRDVRADGETMGEIVMRGNNVMKGYLDDEEATAKAFRGGWFHSGDLGVMHPDGYVELRDRAKDIIISGGENISTVEVEQAVLSHDAYSRPPSWGSPTTIGASVRRPSWCQAGPRRGRGAVIEHVRGQIAHFKAPDTVEFVDELPKTSTGKIQKNVLRQREWAGHAARIQG